MLFFMFELLTLSMFFYVQKCKQSDGSASIMWSKSGVEFVHLFANTNHLA